MRQREISYANVIYPATKYRTLLFFLLANGFVLNIAALSRVRQQYLCVAQTDTLAPPLNVGKHIGEDFLAGLGPD